MNTTEKDLRPVLLFPGQGGYDGAALHQARARHPEVEDVFGRIDTVTVELFGRRLSDVLFGDGPVELPRLLEQDPWISQLAVYGSGLAAHRILTGRGVTPAALIGHSLGEITALVAAGAFSVENGARIVARRTGIVAEGAFQDGAMAAVAASAERCLHLLGLLADSRLAVAAENHDGQTVLSGPREAIEHVRVIGGRLGIGVVELDTPFAFHNPALADSGARFAEFVRGIARHPLTVPVLSPILQRFYAPEEDLAGPLAAHFTRPVRFSAAVRDLYDAGERLFIESGGRAALTSLVTKTLAAGGGAPAEVTVLATLTAGHDGAPALAATLRTLHERGQAEADVLPELRRRLAPTLTDEEFEAFWAAEGTDVVALVTRMADAFRGGPAADGSPDGQDPVTTTAHGTAPAPAQPARPSPSGEPAPARNAPAAPADAAATPATAPPTRSELFEAVRTLYAEALEYPEDVFTPDALLEAELGVDSVKQVELLARASQLYGLPARGSDFRLADYDCLDKIVDLLHDELSRHSAEGAAV
ncbi:acyltransferase domain-containing protein [Streptomyces mutabilis]|uniref:acyltransferase domain-containing protein n=1 Tax=Streptomyces mutabilis TaxID=67332 RepID=UPI00177AFB09|nr:acyltransferase domain-containing protein [Streptomyces mutabilis]GGQ45950.1 acyltransferase [Streptomyces mutabilis]